MADDVEDRTTEGWTDVRGGAHGSRTLVQADRGTEPMPVEPLWQAMFEAEPMVMVPLWWPTSKAEAMLAGHLWRPTSEAEPAWSAISSEADHLLTSNSQQNPETKAWHSHDY